MTDRCRYGEQPQNGSARPSRALTEDVIGEVAERGANLRPSSSLSVVTTTNAVRSDRDVTGELVERIAAGELGANCARRSPRGIRGLTVTTSKRPSRMLV